MGNYFTVNMEENFRRNQDFITEMNKIKTERQIQMRNQMREREMAIEIARSRELFYWFGAFYIVSVCGYLASYRRTRRLMTLSPLVPLSFVMAYQTDLAYGKKIHRIRAEAEIIMQFEQELLELPCGLPTASTIDLGRLQTDEKKFLHPSLPPV